MSVSIYDISEGVLWTEDGYLYLKLKNEKFELLVDYLNASTVESLKEDIDSLNAFEKIRSSKDSLKIEEYILEEIEGFNDLEDGYSAYIAGAHDKSASIQYNIKNDVLSLIHPNIPTLNKYVLERNELIKLATQMIEIHRLKEVLKFRKY